MDREIRCIFAFSSGGNYGLESHNYCVYLTIVESIEYVNVIRQLQLFFKVGIKNEGG
jgi:hypothetical protein